MLRKISLLAVTATAISLALTACVKAPSPSLTGSINGTWSFAPSPVMATIEGTRVTLTADIPPRHPDPRFATISRVVVIGILEEEETTFKLTLTEGDDAIVVTLVDDVPAQEQPTQRTLATAVIRTAIEAAQDESFMLTLDTSDDVDTLTVKGSFITTLLTELGETVPEGGPTATRVR